VATEWLKGRLLMALLLVVILLGLAPGVLDGPDFSGVWSLDRGLSDPPATGPEVALEVAHTAESLSINPGGADNELCYAVLRRQAA
jgi:hypothetical protein